MSQVLVNSTRWSLLQITGILLFLSFIVSKIIILPGYLSATLTLAWILYVPFGLGTLFTHLPIKQIQNFSNELCKIKFIDIIVKWMIGLMLTVAITLLFLLGNFRISDILAPTLLSLVALFHITHKSKPYQSFNKKYFLILLFVLILGGAFAAYVRSFSPYPLTPGIDAFTHFYVIKNILNNSEYSPVLYLQTFHILIALGSNTFGADLVDIFWVGSFMLFPLFSASLYIMTYWFTKNHIHAVLGTIIGLSITEFGQVPNLQVLYPSSFVMSIFPITLFVVDYIWNKSSIEKKLSVLFVLIIFSGFIVLHLELGIVLTLTMTVYLIFSGYVVKNNFLNLVTRLIIILLTIFLFLYYLQYFTHQIHIPLSGIFNTEGYNYNLAEKIKHLKWWYTNEIIIISLAGLIALSFYKDRRVMILGLLASLFLVFYFQDIGIVHRVMTLERPLLSFAAAALLVLPINFIELIFLKARKMKLKKDKSILNNSSHTHQIKIHQNETNLTSVINNDESLERK